MKRYRVRTGTVGALGVTRVFLVAAVTVFAALFYVYQHTQLVRLGYHLRQAEKYLDECVKSNTSLEMKIARIKSPEVLEHLVVKYELNLVSPQAEQIVRVTHPKTKHQFSSIQGTPLGTVN